MRRLLVMDATYGPRNSYSGGARFDVAFAMVGQSGEGGKWCWGIMIENEMKKMDGEFCGICG